MEPLNMALVDGVSGYGENRSAPSILSLFKGWNTRELIRDPIDPLD